MAFSLALYEVLLATLSASGRPILGVSAAVDDAAGAASRAVVLRHDVDRLAFRAVRMAQLEHDLGVRSSYYFRCTRGGRFPAAAVRRISALGHEVGYHYETLSACGGDRRAAAAELARNLDRLRGLAPVRSIVQHGAPLSPHDNQSLMETVDLTALGVADAATALASARLVYLTDTGGRWNADGDENRRDRVAAATATSVDPSDTASFARFLREHDGIVYLSAHPERWPAGRVGQLQAGSTDLAVNLVKRTLAAARRRTA